MSIQIRELPEKYHNAFLFAFLAPASTLFSLLLWLDFYNVYALSAVGGFFIVSDLYFISKLRGGKVGTLLVECVLFLFIAGTTAFLIGTP